MTHVRQNTAARTFGTAYGIPMAVITICIMALGLAQIVAN